MAAARSRAAARARAGLPRQESCAELSALPAQSFALRFDALHGQALRCRDRGRRVRDPRRDDGQHHRDQPGEISSIRPSL